MQHTRDAQLFSKLPSLQNIDKFRQTSHPGATSDTNLKRSNRRRDSGSIELAARESMEREKQGNTETLNVVVEAAYPSEVSHTQGHVTMGKHAIHSNVVHSPSQDTDRVNTQVLSSQADALSFALK